MDQVHLHIRGRVQGVFFRAHTQDMARKLGVTGWVRNTSDGGVEVTAEGPKELLVKLVEWARKGPPAAHVTGVEEEWGTATGKFRDFNVSL